MDFSMLNPTQKELVEYKILVVKVAMDCFNNCEAMLNYEHLCDLEIPLDLA